MKTNLIQTYMNTPHNNLDIDYVLSNKTFIKPLPPKGHLVNKDVFDIPAIAAKDFAYDCKSLYKTSKGIGNDHELGKINDMGMKMGGLMIALYLMTRKQTPLKKAMELVGLASFFGAMSLWPKVALQLPARLIHGFDIRKEYVDSYGRKKMFFQDPQYIPWDLVDDERIQKIGDRLNVPKDIPNRKEFIQEKMKKIAVQNNTLWMLTAGFATPVMSALMCNLCEKPLNKYLGERRSKQADQLLVNLGDRYSGYKDITLQKDLENICTANNGKAVTKDILSEIKNIMTKNVDGVTSTAIANDLDKLLLNDKYILDEEVLTNLTEKLTSIVENSPKIERFNHLLSEYMNKPLTESEIRKVSRLILCETKKTLVESGADVATIQSVIGDKLMNGVLSDVLKSKQEMVLDDAKIGKLKSIGEIITEFKAKNEVLDKYIYLKAGAAPETVIANAFNEVTGDIPKILKISDKEITSIRHDRKLVGNLLREKLEAITSNEEEYKRVFVAITDKISQLDSKLKSIDRNVEGSYQELVESIFNETARLLKTDMPETAERLVGKDGVVKGSLKNIQLSYAKNRLLGVRSSLYRLINTLDFYKRISTLQNVSVLDSQMPKEVKEEIVELSKKLAIDGSTSDFITKFYELRNPNPNMSDFGNIRVENGKVINEFLGKKVNGGKIDLPNDKDFFKNVMKLLFESELHPQTAELLSNLAIDKGVRQYRQEFLHEIGDASYFVKPFHLLHEFSTTASSYTQFLKIGMTPEQMLHNTVKEAFNTRKWLKMFGGFGAALLGVSVIAQFFFGKMQNPERVKND